MELDYVAFDNPWPADYGGAVELAAKLEALAQAGAKIRLHYFARPDRPPTPDLERVACEVFRYARPSALLAWWQRRPLMVGTRSSRLLLNRLLESKAPIFFDGLQTTAPLFKLLKRQPERLVLLRMHNRERAYYFYRWLGEPNLLRRFALHSEIHRLKFYEPTVIRNVDAVLALSVHEADEVQCPDPPDAPASLWVQALKQRENANVLWLPAFIGRGTPMGTLPPLPAKPKAVYLANFDIPENREAAHWLLDMKDSLPLPLVLAGRHLNQWFATASGCELHSDVPDAQALYRSSGIALVPQQIAAGVKIKVLDALAAGCRVLATPAALYGTGLEGLLPTFETQDECQQLLAQTLEGQLEEQFARAQRFFASAYDPARNARMLLDYIAWLGQQNRGYGAELAWNAIA